MLTLCSSHTINNDLWPLQILMRNSTMLYIVSSDIKSTYPNFKETAVKISLRYYEQTINFPQIVSEIIYLIGIPAF